MDYTYERMWESITNDKLSIANTLGEKSRDDPNIALTLPPIVFPYESPIMNRDWMVLEPQNRDSKSQQSHNDYDAYAS